jgi:FdrA protein
MIIKNIIKENTYLDSIILMSISNQLMELEDVIEVSTIMGTESNKEILKNIGLLVTEGEKAKPGDLIIALQVKDVGAANRVLKKAERFISQRETLAESSETLAPRSLETALQSVPSANLVIISVPGQYAGSIAMDALEGGRHVMIFSDNVPLDTEIELKKRAQELDLLVMGPDCGTAIINGIALGFANVIRKGPFGIVGASGTGIQEISTLLHKKGYGITHALGLGGRDLSREVMGMSMLQGIRAMENDIETEIVFLLSKPPAPDVAVKILDIVKTLKKKYIITFLNGDSKEAQKRGLHFSGGLEEAVDLAIEIYEKREKKRTLLSDNVKELRACAEKEREKIGTGKFLRGLFSGGTLADEALVILSRTIGDIYSNTPLNKDQKLVDSWKSMGHTIIDMGEDEFTRGRPHPMIDFSLRCDRLLKEAQDNECGVILLDVVLGYGSHPDPASVLAPVIDRARKKRRAHIAFVASITGTEDDPQDLSKQRDTLLGVGVTILPSNAQAARYAGLILKHD